jgi:hypothetical protein
MEPNALTAEKQAARNLLIRRDDDGLITFGVKFEFDFGSIIRSVVVIDKSFDLNALFKMIENGDTDVTDLERDRGDIEHDENGRTFVVARWNTSYDGIDGIPDLAFITTDDEEEIDTDNVNIIAERDYDAELPKENGSCVTTIEQIPKGQSTKPDKDETNSFHYAVRFVETHFPNAIIGELKQVLEAGLRECVCTHPDYEGPVATIRFTPDKNP